MNMKKRTATLCAAALAVMATWLLTGCGASLDREVVIQGMTIEVPGNWLETPAEGNTAVRGSVSFVDEDDDRDEDETASSIIVSYRQLDEATSSTDPDGSDASVARVEAAELATDILQIGSAEDEEPVTEGESNAPDATSGSSVVAIPRTAAEAIAAKQAQMEKRFDVIAWCIDKEKTQVIDGAQVTTYEYSFVKEIDGVKRTYEYRIVYVVTPEMMYEISAIGDEVDINALVDSIEL